MDRERDIDFGGNNEGNIRSGGATYDPVTDSWNTLFDNANQPVRRVNPIALWIGTGLIIYSRYDYEDYHTDGKVYSYVSEITTLYRFWSDVN